MDQNFAADIPMAIACAAHAGTSFTPERRAEQERESYAAELSADYEMLARYANTDEKKAQLEEEFARYRSGYRRRFLVYLGARSRCMSTMITGGSNFPTARNQKRLDTERRRVDDLQGFRERALAAIKKALTPELQPIMAGAADAVERLRAEIAKLEKRQEGMKSVNRAIRLNAAGGEANQLTVLKAMGYPESAARELLKPDFAGCIGFADYELKNNGANIRRLHQRLKAIEAAKAAPTEERQGAGGIRVEDSPADNRIRAFFPGKPDEATRNALKAHGFRWTPSLGCWQAYRNTSSLAHAQALLNVQETT